MLIIVLLKKLFACLRNLIERWMGGIAVDVAAEEVAPIAEDVEQLKADVATLKENVLISAHTSEGVPQSGEDDDLLLIKVAVVACAVIGFALWIKSQQKSA